MRAAYAPGGLLNSARCGLLVLSPTQACLGSSAGTWTGRVSLPRSRRRLESAVYTSQKQTVKLRMLCLSPARHPRRPTNSWTCQNFSKALLTPVTTLTLSTHVSGRLLEVPASLADRQQAVQCGNVQQSCVPCACSCPSTTAQATHGADIQAVCDAIISCHTQRHIIHPLMHRFKHAGFAMPR